MNNRFLEPGDLSFATQGEILETILGSCVAVCIWDKEKHIGGMIHYVLPDRQSDHSQPNSKDDNKYACNAIPNLLKEFKKAGSQREHLVAKLLGGASVIEGVQADVGGANIKIANELLRKFQIPIVARSLRGYSGRRVKFNSGSGDVSFQLMTETGRTEEKTTDNLMNKLFKDSGDKSKEAIVERNISSDKRSEHTKVLIVDDSASVRKVLESILKQDPQIEIVGSAASALEAEQMRSKLKPDVMTLDIHMPEKDGVQYLRELMQSSPMPVIMVTDYNLKETGPVIEALELGAFDYVKKPSLTEMTALGEDLRLKVKEASKVNVANLKRKNYSREKVNVATMSERQLENTLVLIGASTGGTEALKTVLMMMPKEIPAIVVVQHMPPGFTKIFAERLDQLCPFNVKEAEEGDIVTHGNVYIAPGAFQCKLSEGSTGVRIHITDDPPLNRFKPSVDYLFNSGLNIRARKKIAVIMTGMGADGAKGILELHHQRVHTIGQDEKSCTVYGMPKAAYDLGGISKQVPLDKIAEEIFNAIMSPI